MVMAILICRKEYDLRASGEAGAIGRREDDRQALHSGFPVANHLLFELV